MEKDIHVSHKGQDTATNREKGQGITRTRAGAAPCENGLARTQLALSYISLTHLHLFDMTNIHSL
jgi:hypothetical protein